MDRWTLRWLKCKFFCFSIFSLKGNCVERVAGNLREFERAEEHLSGIYDFIVNMCMCMCRPVVYLYPKNIMNFKRYAALLS